MLGRPSPNCPHPCHLQHCLPLPLVPLMCHPIKSSSWCTPSAGWTQMTLAAFLSGHAWGTNTSWLPSIPMAISSSSKQVQKWPPLHCSLQCHDDKPGSQGSFGWPPDSWQQGQRGIQKSHTFKWNSKFQLVPPDMHCQNQAECTICTLWRTNLGSGDINFLCRSN